MFFSIIIPTYNPLNYIQKLLNSIITNKCTDEVEIILADDCSTESLDILLETYSDLNIRIILNKEHLGFPRAGRQNGLDAAKGKWIMFADQDDYFEDNALDKLKAYIETKHLKNCIFTPFMLDFPEQEKKMITNHFSGWTHGKLFEHSFLKQYNIKYNEITYHEDVCFITNIQCLLIDKNITYYDLDYIFYHWVQNENSLSNSDNYIIEGLSDYAMIIKPIYNYFKKYKPDDPQYSPFFQLFISMYFRNYYYQQLKIVREDKHFKEYRKEWNKILYPYLKDYRNKYNLKNIDIVNYIRTKFINFYNDIRSDHCKYTAFFEYETFEQWLNENFPD